MEGALAVGAGLGVEQGQARRGPGGRREHPDDQERMHGGS